MYISSHFFPRNHVEQKRLERDFDCADKVFFGIDKVIVFVLALLATLTFLSLHGIPLGSINAMSSWGAAAGYGCASTAIVLFLANGALLIVRYTVINRRQEGQLDNLEEEKRALNDELQAVKKQLAEAMENQVSTQKAALEKRTNKLTKEIQVAQQEIDDLNQTLARKEMEFNHSKAGYEKEKKELSQEIKNREAEIEKFNTHFEEELKKAACVIKGMLEDDILARLGAMLAKEEKMVESKESEEEAPEKAEASSDEEVNPDDLAKQTQKRVSAAMIFSWDGKSYPLNDLDFKCLIGQENDVRARAAFFKISQAGLPCDSVSQLVELSTKINDAADKESALDELEKNSSLMKKHLEEILKTTALIPGSSPETCFKPAEFF